MNEYVGTGLTHPDNLLTNLILKQLFKS